MTEPKIIRSYKNMHIITDGESYALMRIRHKLFGKRVIEYNDMTRNGIDLWGHPKFDWLYWFNLEQIELRLNKHMIADGSLDPNTKLATF